MDTNTWWGEAPEQPYDFNEAAALLWSERFGYTNLLAEPRSIA
jgi:hypothetical protein